MAAKTTTDRPKIRFWIQFETPNDSSDAHDFVSVTADKQTLNTLISMIDNENIIKGKDANGEFTKIIRNSTYYYTFGPHYIKLKTMSDILNLEGYAVIDTLTHPKGRSPKDSQITVYTKTIEVYV